jgi:isocitrate/isopropylmalate dehydrogenase
MEDSVVLMLEFLYYPDASQTLMGAIEAVMAEDRVLTSDLGGQTGTPKFTLWVRQRREIGRIQNTKK